MERCKKGGFTLSDLEYLVKNDTNFKINDQDSNGSTLLMYCSTSGKAEEVNSILKNGAFVDFEVKGQTALHLAAKFGQGNVVWRLLKAGANKNKKDEAGLTPADYANRSEYYKIVEMLGGKPLNLYEDAKRKEAIDLLLKVHKSEISIPDFERQFYGYGPLIDEPFFNGNTLLHTAAYFGKLPLALAALRLKADPNVQNETGSTPLVYAIHQNNLPVVEELIKAGADPKIKNKDGNTALDFATGKIQLYMTDIMTKIDSKNVKTQEGIIRYLKSSLNPSKFKALVKKNEEEIKELNKELIAKTKVVPPSKPARPAQLKMPFNVMIQKVYEHIEVGNTSGLIFFLDNGLPPDARGPNGNPIILQIVFLGHMDMLKALVSRGANINIKGIDGFTPLMVASKHYKYDIASYLVKIGADKSLKNNFDWAALDYARQNRDDRMMFITRF